MHSGSNDSAQQLIRLYAAPDSAPAPTIILFEIPEGPLQVCNVNEGRNNHPTYSKNSVFYLLNLFTMANWHAVYTRPRWEKKVCDSLQKKRIEHYCPITRVAYTWGGPERRKAVFQPVFSSYVFVKTTEAELEALKQIDGVINILYWRDKPATIRDIEIEMMRRFLQEHATIALERTVVNTTEIVKISNLAPDPDGGEDGLYKVRLTLPSLGYRMEAEVMEEAPVHIKPATTPIQTAYAKLG